VACGGKSGLLAALFAFVFSAALVTEAIGIHALFGAFLAGVCMPPDAKLRQFLRERLETFSSVFLLPLFFAFTGLRTQVGLLGGLGDWLLCLLIIVVASVGKFGGTFAAARISGLPSREAASLGILMNTRGLVELIVLNIGLDLRVISPRLFAMLVIMALVTTVATTPILHALSRRPGIEPARQAAPAPG
jgi:Kef-type K+ transport system membrane component KefB